MSAKDTLYSSSDIPKPFSFNKKISTVFDDMVQRSIPGYAIQQDFIADFALQTLNNNRHGHILDIGASLGKSITHISNSAKKKHISLLQNTAILCDNSIDMIHACKKNITSVVKYWKHIYVKHLDITNKVQLQSILQSVKNNLQVVILHYVLQFIDPTIRFTIAQTIWNTLEKGGILLLGEKLCSENPAIQKIWQQQHINFKLSHGYSLTEIHNKQQALQNILIPTSDITMNNFITSLAPTYTSIYFSFGEFFCYCIIK